MAFRHQVHQRIFSCIQPVTGKTQRRARTGFKPKHVMIEISRALEIIRSHGHVVQLSNRHKLAPLSLDVHTRLK